MRQVWRQSRREGFSVARYTVERLMTEMGLQDIIRGKPVRARPCRLSFGCVQRRSAAQFRATLGGTGIALLQPPSVEPPSTWVQGRDRPAKFRRAGWACGPAPRRCAASGGGRAGPDPERPNVCRVDRSARPVQFIGRWRSGPAALSDLRECSNVRRNSAERSGLSSVASAEVSGCPNRVPQAIATPFAAAQS